VEKYSANSNNSAQKKILWLNYILHAYNPSIALACILTDSYLRVACLESLQKKKTKEGFAKTKIGLLFDFGFLIFIFGI